MIKIKQHIVFCILLLYSLPGISRGWETANKEELLTVIDKAVSWFVGTTKYSVKVLYSSYKDHSSVHPYEQSFGSIKRDGSFFSTVSMGIRTIQNKDMQLMVDSLNEVLVINNKTDFDQKAFDSNGLKMLLEYAKEITRNSGDNGLIHYKIVFKPNSVYDQYEIVVNASGQMVLVKCFYATEQSKEEGEGEVVKGKPRLEITFSDYNTKMAFDYEKEFSEKKYFEVENGNLKLKGAVSTYEVKDYRFIKKK